MQGVLASRIDLLAPADKLVLQAAAVVGRVFWREPLRLLTAGLLEDPANRPEDTPAEPGSEGPPGDPSLEESLRRLEARDLVSAQVGSSFAGQPEYLFKHVLTRDVAYDGIPRRERGAAHAQVARWLERTAGDRAPEFGELLAHHYSTAASLAAQARDGSDPSLRVAAVEWLLRASDDALSKYVLGKAERLAHDALDLAQGDVERCDVLSALGSAYLVGASVSDVRGDLAWRHLSEAAAVADESPDIPDLRAARLIARACELPVRWPGHMSAVPPEPEVRALRDRGLALAGPGDSRERASLLAISASWPFAFPAESAEPLEVCVARGLEAADVALRLGDADLASACYDAATSAYESLGDFRSAMEIWRRRWRLRDRLTDDLEVVDLYGMGAWESWETGDYEGAIRYAEAIEGKLQHPGAAHAQAWRVTALFRLGRWDEALATFVAMSERLDTRRGSPPNAYTQMYGAAAIVYEARADRRRADDVAAAMAVPEYGCRVYAWRIEVALQRGEFEGARELVATPPPAAWQVHASVVWEARCDTALASGDWERAAEVAEGARQYHRAGGSPSVAAVADRLEGAAALAAGHADRAVRVLARAVHKFDGLGMTWEAARTRRVLAVALARAGRREQAAAEQAAADAALTALGVVEDRVVDAVLSAPQIRELGHTA